MTYPQQIRIEKDEAGEYAAHEDFCRVFTENLKALYQLSYVLTLDGGKARQCFLGGLEDCLKLNHLNHVGRDRAYSIGKLSIVRNAIRALRPQPLDADSSLTDSVVSQESKLRVIRDGHLEIDSVLALEDFERFVFAMTILERYSDADSALLLGCSIGEIRAGRLRALKEVANLACTDYPEVSAGVRA
jgi:hypothetical protein